MIRKYKDYIILLASFLLIIFSTNINRFLYALNNDLDIDNITNDYCVFLESDYNALLEINDFKNDSELNLIMSKVYLRDIYSFSDSLTIYKGSNSDIEEGMAVINNLGLVGVIKKTDKEASVVELITSKNSNVSVKINDNYGILKVVQGELVVSDLQASSNISVGDKVYTSGLGNLPGDIYVGEVSATNLNNTEIEMFAYVNPAVELKNINYVLVVE